MEQPQVAPVAPQAPQSNDDAIGSFARGFLAEIERDDDPDQMQHGIDEEEAPQEAQDEAPTEETEQPEAEEATPTEPEIPVVEVEIDGEKFQVPEKLKGRLMADKDYRQKTMALAEQRKQFDQMTATVQQLAEQAQQMAPYHAQLFAMDNRANQLQQALQSRELADDPIEFNKTQGELAILLRNRDHFAAQLGQAQTQFQHQFQAVQAQKLAAEAPALFEEIPALKEEPTRQNLVKYLQESGADEQVLGYINFSVLGTKLAYKAMQYDRMVADQAKARTKLAEKVKTAPPVAAQSRVPVANAQEKQLQKDWKKGGGKLHDPAFSALLRSKLRGK